MKLLFLHLVHCALCVILPGLAAACAPLQASWHFQ